MILVLSDISKFYRNNSNHKERFMADIPDNMLNIMEDIGDEMYVL